MEPIVTVSKMLDGEYIRPKRVINSLPGDMFGDSYIQNVFYGRQIKCQKCLRTCLAQNMENVIGKKRRKC